MTKCPTCNRSFGSDKPMTFTCCGKEVHTGGAIVAIPLLDERAIAIRTHCGPKCEHWGTVNGSTGCTLIPKPYKPCDVMPLVAGGEGCFDRNQPRFPPKGTDPFTVHDAQFIPTSQLFMDAQLLIGEIPSDITAIAGVARSGMAVASMLAMQLHLPLLTIRQTRGDVIESGNGWRLGASHVGAERDHVLVVDDTVMTGNSIRSIKRVVGKAFGRSLIAAVYVNPLAKRKPDLWVRDLPWPHLLEWNLFNSVLSPNMAMDFDGVLCHDCQPADDDDGPRYDRFIRTAKPLYVPRKEPIPLIVTARIEKYRSDTESWLRKHGIRWHRLVMHPAKTLAERRADDIAAYKAHHFGEWASSHVAAPPPLAFIESDDAQARRIAELSGRMVICPATAQVY